MSAYFSRSITNKKRSRGTERSAELASPNRPGFTSLLGRSRFLRLSIFDLPGGSMDEHDPTRINMGYLFSEESPEVRCILRNLFYGGEFIPIPGGHRNPDWWQQMIVRWQSGLLPDTAFQVPPIPRSSTRMAELYIVLHWKIASFLRDTLGNRPARNAFNEVYRNFFMDVVLLQLEEALYAFIDGSEPREESPKMSRPFEDSHQGPMDDDDSS